MDVINVFPHEDGADYVLYAPDGVTMLNMLNVAGATQLPMLAEAAGVGCFFRFATDEIKDLYWASRP